MKRALILVAGVSNLPLIIEAKNLGLHVITCDNDPDNPGHKLADENILIDVYDYKAILERLKHTSIDFVFTFISARGLVTAAKITDSLGLKGYSEKSLNTLLTKNLFREFLKTHNLDFPKFTSLSNIDNLSIENLKFPVILKPTDGAGSCGVQKAHSVAEVKSLFSETQKHSQSNSVIIEEFIESDKLINGDCLIKDGRILAAIIGDYSYNKDLSLVLPIATLFPGKHDSSRTVEQLNKIISSLNLPDGIINFEAILTEDRSFIIEINPRPSGNYLWKIMEYKFNINIPETILRLALNEPLENLIANEKYYAYQLIYSTEEKIFYNFDISESIKPYIKDKFIFTDAGSDINRMTNLYERVGLLLLEFPNRSSMDSTIKQQYLFQIS